MASETPIAWQFLPPTLRKQVEQGLGFERPTPVQSASIPRILRGESFSTVAPTGTGKTLAFLIGITQTARRPQARSLVLVPTRELGYQVSQMLRDLEPGLYDETLLVLGGHSLEGQLQSSLQRDRVVVATPGRLLDFIEHSPGFLKPVRLLVLDEFDKLIGMGFREQIAALIGHLGSDCQKLLFSATTPDEAISKELKLEGLPELEIERPIEPDRLEERIYYLKSAKKKKDLLLQELEAGPTRAIVFVRNREKANHLHGLLKLRGYPCRVLHGKLEQSLRAEVYQGFKDKAFPILIATDLAARGLDFEDVELIVNFDLPRNGRDYVHRLGRTARAGKVGRCLSFAGPDEYLPMRNLERDMTYEIQPHPSFARRDIWFSNSKRLHDSEVRKEKRIESIRRQQQEDDDDG